MYTLATLCAGVAELVDAPDSKSGSFGSAGSIPALGTNSKQKLYFDPVSDQTKEARYCGLFCAYKSIWH